MDRIPCQHWVVNDVVYHPADRPDVEILHDGQWYAGELRMWTRTKGGWAGQVQWHRGVGDTLIDTFPADQIRQAPEGNPEHASGSGRPGDA